MPYAAEIMLYYNNSSSAIPKILIGLGGVNAVCRELPAAVGRSYKSPSLPLEDSVSGVAEDSLAALAGVQSAWQIKLMSKIVPSKPNLVQSKSKIICSSQKQSIESFSHFQAVPHYCQRRTT